VRKTLKERYFLMKLPTKKYSILI